MLTSALLLSVLGVGLTYDCKAPEALSKRKWNGYEYLVSPTYLTFDQCKYFCDSEEMQVASVHSAPEAAVVDTFCTDATASSKCYLGMECVDDLDCTWTDGTPVDWTPYSNVEVKTFYQCATSAKKYGLAGYYPHACDDYLPCMCKAVATPSCGTYNVDPSDLPVTFEACMESEDCEKATCGMDFTVHTPMCLMDHEEALLMLRNGECCTEKKELCCDMDFKENGVVKLSGGEMGTIYQWKVQAQDKYNSLSKLVDCVVKVGVKPGCGADCTHAQ